MNQCPQCGLQRGLHHSILPGCMCTTAGPFTYPVNTPQRTWVGLTQEDINIAFDDTQEGGGFDDFARAIEATLKRKNT